MNVNNVILIFRKAKRGGSNVFALFSQRAIQEFKEAFGIMDADKVSYNNTIDFNNIILLFKYNFHMSKSKTFPFKKLAGFPIQTYILDWN